MNKINHQRLWIITLIFSIVLTTACQKKQPQTDEKTSQVDALLTSITIDALKEQNFKSAQRSIQALIINNDKPKAWDFIQSALISIPEQLATEVINNSLEIDIVNQSPPRLFGIAKTLIAYKNTQKALDTINMAIDIGEKDLEAIYWRARLLTVMKDYKAAEKDFEYVIAKDPNNQSYTDQYASFLQETKQFKKAQKMLEKSKKTADSLFKRIVFALQNKDNETASIAFEQLKNITVEQEKSDHKNFLIAESAYWLERPAESEKYYRKVTGGDHYLDARDMLSLLLYEDKRYNESIEILHQLQNAEIKFAVKAYRLEAQISKDQGDTDKAIKILSQSLKILPKNPDLLYDRAMLYESIDQINNLEKDLQTIIKDDPENFEALNALGYSLADHDIKLEEALEYINKAIKLAPENPAIIDSLGWAQYKLGHYLEAEINFNKALQKGIKDVDLYIHLYHTLIKLDKHQEAQALINKANDLFPDNKKILALKKNL